MPCQAFFSSVLVCPNYNNGFDFNKHYMSLENRGLAFFLSDFYICLSSALNSEEFMGFSQCILTERIKDLNQKIL